VADNFLKRYVVAEKQLRTRATIERLLRKHILPQWGKRAFREIKRGDIAELQDQIVDAHGARTADYCLSIIRKMSTWYATRNHDYVSPVVSGMQRYQVRDHRGTRFLDDHEIRALWTASAEQGTFGAVCRVLLLTGQRREKVLRMHWSAAGSTSAATSKTTGWRTASCAGATRWSRSACALSAPWSPPSG
jgi:integrase